MGGGSRGDSSSTISLASSIISSSGTGGISGTCCDSSIGCGYVGGGNGYGAGGGQATEGFQYFHALSLPFFIVWDVVGN